MLAIGGAEDGKERDPISENVGAPTALVFIHRLNVRSFRCCASSSSMASNADRANSEIVFLPRTGLPGKSACAGRRLVKPRVGLRWMARRSR